MVTNKISNINQNADKSLMKKIAWKTLIVSTIIISIISGVGNNLQNFEEYDENPPLGLSNSDSWSKIVKERSWSTPYCELVNGSLYIIGVTSMWDDTNPYFYVSKFNTSGIKEWELSIKLDHCFVDSFLYVIHFTYVFDSDSNLIVLIESSLIKINSSGALLFSKEIDPSLTTSQNSLVLGENNSLLIVGGFDYYRRIFIMKFNNAGQFLWNTSFISNYFFIHPYIVTDSEYNMYLVNNSLCSLSSLVKINSSGAIVWQMGLENIKKLIVDSDNNLFILWKNSSTGYILKLNSTGNQIKEILIENFDAYFANIWHLNDLFVFNRYNRLILCYDLNLYLKWSFSLSDYINPHSHPQTFLAKDSHDNVYIIQNNEIGNINLVKISSTGEFLSRITWGGILNEKPRSLIIDLDNNIYFSCFCEYFDVWRERYAYNILVKNPVNGGIPPEPIRDLDIRDYFLFSVVGIACIISPIALLSILRSNKKRIG